MIMKKIMMISIVIIFATAVSSCTNMSTQNNSLHNGFYGGMDIGESGI